MVIFLGERINSKPGVSFLKLRLHSVAQVYSRLLECWNLSDSVGKLGDYSLKDIEIFLTSMEHPKRMSFKDIEMLIWQIFIHLLS